MNKYGTVLMLYNAPGGSSSFVESEAGVLDEVKAVADSLDHMGITHKEIGLLSLRELPAALTGIQACVAVNLVEGFPETPEDAFLVPATCRAFGVEVTGNNTSCLALSTDKWRTKALLIAAGLRCPAGIVVPVGQDVPSFRLPQGLCIVKPIATDAGEGIDAHSIVESSNPRLHELVTAIHERFGQAAIVEEMIGQREFNVSLLQTGDSVRVLPLAEIDFSAFGADRPRIVGYAAKWKRESFEFSNTPRTFKCNLTMSQQDLIRNMALAAWRTLGCRDYVRVDFRLTDQCEPVILEVNANPDISPDAGFAAALHEGGISSDDFARTLLDNAMSRKMRESPLLSDGRSESSAWFRNGALRVIGRDGSPPAPMYSGSRLRTPRRCVPTGMCNPVLNRAESSIVVRDDVLIRRAAPQDREVVMGLLNQPNFFRRDELLIAEEVFDDAIKSGEQGHYQSFVLEERGQVAGWVCYGPTPCTLGTFDIYWIVVAEARQGRKLGSALMEFVEKEIRGRDGRIAVVETSGLAVYASTRKFYERLGYHEAARVKNFYAPGDDKVISVKILFC